MADTPLDNDIFTLSPSRPILSSTPATNTEGHSHSPSWSSSSPSTLVQTPATDKILVEKDAMVKDTVQLEAAYATAEFSEKVSGKRRRMPNRNRCVRCLCCACCLPLWATRVVWCFIIAIIIVVIVIGSILATFKMPTIEFQGIAPLGSSSQSTIAISGEVLTIGFGLIVNIVSANIFPIYLTNMAASAYYPFPDQPSVIVPIGDGYLDYQYVPVNSNTNFTFPFTIKYNPATDPNLSILGSIADKCGLTGGPKQDLNIQYNIQLNARVLLFTVPITIGSSANFPCPLDSDALPGLNTDSLSQMFGS